jgi:tyrosine-specific transport protein
LTSSSFSKTFGGAMLVSGTCIGAGMLGLPISTALAGFYPSALTFILCWFMMTLSAFLMLEVSLWYPQETNLISMAKATLGKPGETIAWITYVLFLYALMTAYTTVAGGIIAKGLVKAGLDGAYGTWIIVFMFSAIVYFGARSVDWTNRLLMTGLVGAYAALVLKVTPEVSLDLLSQGQPKYLLSAGPLLVTSFGFHLLIPSLKNYLQGNTRSLRQAIFMGSLLPLIVYLLWEMLILGVVPVKGEQGLLQIMHAEYTTGKQAVVELTELLSYLLNDTKITFFAAVFGLCAILTSFIGVALGLFDFFADGFHIKKTIRGRFVLATLTFLPPILISIYYPRFLTALHYAGVFAAVLLVIYPALMVWSGRYRLKMATGYRVKGGKFLVILTLLFGLGVIMLEILTHLHVLPNPLSEFEIMQ